MVEQIFAGASHHFLRNGKDLVVHFESEEKRFLHLNTLSLFALSNLFIFSLFVFPNFNENHSEIGPSEVEGQKFATFEAAGQVSHISWEALHRGLGVRLLLEALFDGLSQPLFHLADVIIVDDQISATIGSVKPA